MAFESIMTLLKKYPGKRYTLFIFLPKKFGQTNVVFLTFSRHCAKVQNPGIRKTDILFQNCAKAEDSVRSFKRTNLQLAV